MDNWTKLYCKEMNQNLELQLWDHAPSMLSVDLAKCKTVFENGWYCIDFNGKNQCTQDVDSIIVNVNGSQVGIVDFDKNSKDISGYVLFQKEDIKDTKKCSQPFLLQYDIIVLSFQVVYSDGTHKEWFTNFMLCVSKSKNDVENIKQMLESLRSFNDTQIADWIFSSVSKRTSVGLLEGAWQQYCYKSLSSYIQLLEKMVECYRANYSYFRSKGKHTLTKHSMLQPHQNIKSVSCDSFQWLMQNTNQFAEVSTLTGIKYQGKNYIPLKAKTQTSRKSWDIYENQVIVSFLNGILKNASQIYKEFDEDVLKEENILKKINGCIPSEYHTPILTIKSLQTSYNRIILDKLSGIIVMIHSLYTAYVALFNIQPSLLVTLPRKTKTFQEIKPYREVFSCILHWFNYGELSLEKERLVLQVKTLDKLFEYYCLIELLKLFAKQGYHKADVPHPAFNFAYTTTGELYENERDVANTYILCKGRNEITIYYQPVISATQFQNKLQLYRTTQPYNKGKPNYYTPDFVVKFTAPAGQEEYVILDSKFSTRDNIRNYYLREVMQKYSHEVSVAKTVDKLQMVWILQGRITSGDNLVWKFHNSLLANTFNPKPSFGIVSINTEKNFGQRFWDELKLNIPWIE